MFFFSTESHKHKNIQRVGALAYRVGVYHLISSHLKVKRASRVSTAEGVGRGEGGGKRSLLFTFLEFTTGQSEMDQGLSKSWILQY